MKNFYIVVVLTLFSCTQANNKLTVETSINKSLKCQAESNIDAGTAYKMADQQLNREYQTILKNYKEDTIFIEKLQKAQRVWIMFRDAEVEMKYPCNSEIRNGSAFDLCCYSYLTELTKQRTATLKVWNTGMPEGDICSGSVNTILSKK